MAKRSSKSSSPLNYRAAAINVRAADDPEAPMRGVLTTEQPVEMIDWERFEVVPEVLLMSGMTARGQSLKLMDSHDTGSVRNVLGAFDDIRKHKASKDTPHDFVDGTIRVSSVHQDVSTKLREGFINEMSVGYSYQKSVYIPEGETQKIEGKEFTGPVNVRTKWTAAEASLVALGADDQAQIRGFANAAEALKSHQETEKQEPLAQSENLNQIPRTISQSNQPTEPMSEQTAPPAEPTPAPAPARSSATTSDNTDNVLSAERERANAIATIADDYGKREEGRKAIAEGMSTSAFIASVGGSMRSPQPVTADPIPWSERDAKRWSLGRAARLIADGKPLDGIEAEVTQEIGKRTNKTTRGFFLPGAADVAQFGRADVTLTAGTATDGAELVPTTTAANRYIPFFTPNPVMWDLGATVITGVTENFNVPVESSTATAGTAAEDVATAESQPQFATVSFTPHSYGFFTEVTKRLLYQSSTATEQILRTIMNRQMTIAFDQDGINGSGSGQCDGIISHTDAATVTITTAGTPDFDEILEFEEDVETANALESNCGYLTTPAVKKALKKTAEYGTDRNPIWTNQMFGNGESQGMVNGYRAVSSNQSPSNSVIFGDFSYYWYVIFDGVEITVTEDATLAKRRAVQFTCNIDLDGKPVKGAAFSHNV